MNVTPSKILLGLSLAAYTYVSWDHIFPAKAAEAAPSKGPVLTTAMVNRSIPLKLERDPFNSVPLGQTLGAAMPTAVDPGKDLGDLKLTGCMVTLMRREAVINGKSVHEGDITETSTGVKVKVTRIGVGYCVIEGAGQLVMLKIDDKPGAGAAAAAPSSGAPSAGGRVPYVAKDKMPLKKN